MRTATWMIGLALAVMGATSLAADEPRDSTKRRSEASTERVIEASTDTASSLLPDSAPPHSALPDSALPDSALPARPDLTDRDLIRWHANLAAAQQAAQVTGRPILFFQLLGSLDKEHC